MRIGAIEKFMLDDVRCFEGRHEFNIRPLTFLVGENSTGKSTVLGCLQLLDRSSLLDMDFNSEPYRMGAFSDIVRKARPRKTEFQLGITLACSGVKGGQLQVFLKFRENQDRTEPIIDEVRWVFSEGEIVFSGNADQQGRYDSIGSFNIAIGENRNEFHVLMEKEYLGLNPEEGLGRFMFFLQAETGTRSKEVQAITDFLHQQFEVKKNGETDEYSLFFAYAELDFLWDSYSIAPIRSKPRRTYDPLKEVETPEGSEMPMVLMRLSATTEDEWFFLKEDILNFGRVSGLFTDVRVRHLGKLGDPFQLQIKVRGPRSNLIDVGYGVSQILPILVRILREKQTRFLLQQPEVHLHPKGQAELTSLFVDVIKKRQNSFVIETHSDYMIDRARIEIMKGRLNPEDVSLIYLEPVQNKVMVHNISFDSEGNMNGVPHGYRAFFLKESDKLLGFGE